MMERTVERPLSTADLAAAADTSRDGRPVGSPDADAASPQPSADGHEELVELFPPEAAKGFKTRWDDVQIGFVDDPKQAVRKADELVAQVMKSLAETFAKERAELERYLDNSGEGSTEDLRLALQRYRSFFHRLLSL
jgi:hypothetical protein